MGFEEIQENEITVNSAYVKSIGTEEIASTYTNFDLLGVKEPIENKGKRT